MAAPLRTEVLVVGAGISGLATAARIASNGSQVVVLERHGAAGRETSSRSSEVLHAGLYYAPGSAKAELCVEGAAQARERCSDLGIPCRSIGKLVVAATPAEEEPLEGLFQRARDNGAPGVELLTGIALARLEPRLRGVAALLSPLTAVVDSSELLRSYLVEARHHGAEMAFRHHLRGLQRGGGDGWTALVEGPEGEHLEVEAAAVVNAAGLDSDRVAAMAGIDTLAAGYEIHPCKGDYFSVRPGAVTGIERLIYPMPEAHARGLGIHLTFDVGGAARLGPDATYVAPGTGYDVDETKAGAFLSSARRLLPWLEASDIAPERSGIRPKLSGPGEPARDFIVRHEAGRGLPGLVSLVGIESPGLTAAPAIARRVADLLTDAGLIPAPKHRS